MAVEKLRSKTSNIGPAAPPKSAAAGYGKTIKETLPKKMQREHIRHRPDIYIKPGTCLSQKEKKYSRDLQLSMPSMVDGLKPDQRKVLFHSFKHNFFKGETIARFCGYIFQHSCYWEAVNLESTVIGMAQDFVGSNNINFLQPDGQFGTQFGTRYMGGEDAEKAKRLFTPRLSPITRYLFPMDDDIVLDYLNKDGQSAEPSWYMPVIPTVLVNGSEGIGTEWSTYIPSYNPRDIVANIRKLLNSQPMEPMDPWFKGFRGRIEKSTTTEEGGVSYSASGIIEVINETTLRITELPIRRWSQEYKEFLTSMATENDKNKDPFIKGFRDCCDETTVHFEVILSKENLAMANSKDVGLLKKFGLRTTISTSNMHLNDSVGKIQKYNTPEEILEEFFHLRLKFYAKRKKALLDHLELELVKLENKLRYLHGLMNREFSLAMDPADLVVQLRDKGFTPLPKKTKAAEVESSDSIINTNGNSEAVASKDVRASGYDYLLSLGVADLFLENVQKLRAEKDKVAGKVDDLKNAHPRSLWLKDLDALDIQLDEQDKRDEQEEVERKAMRSRVMPDAGLRASKEIPKSPRKNNEKALIAESVPEAKETSNSSTKLTNNNAPEVAKRKGRAGAKKAPARKRKAATALIYEDDDVEDELTALEDRLAAYNRDCSSDQPEGAAAAREKPVY